MTRNIKYYSNKPYGVYGYEIIIPTKYNNSDKHDCNFMTYTVKMLNEVQLEKPFALHSFLHKIDVSIEQVICINSNDIIGLTYLLIGFPVNDDMDRNKMLLTQLTEMLPAFKEKYGCDIDAPPCLFAEMYDDFDDEDDFDDIYE